MRFTKLFHLAVALISVFNATTAQASDVSYFNCLAGDIEYSVSMDGFLPPFVTVSASVSEMMDQNLNRKFALNRSNDTGGALAAYRGADQYHGEIVFSASGPDTVRIGFKDGSSVACLSDSQDDDTGESLESYVNRQMTQFENEGQRTPVNALGMSLGGNMRSAPGSGYNRTAKVSDGQDLIIASRSGVVENGFPWFEVQLSNGQKGFMHGSDLCSAAYKAEGVYERCRAWDNISGDRRSDTSAGHSWDWMAFAVDNTGSVGHGVHPKRSMAGTLAIKNCGQGCRVVDDAQAKCHALYHSFENGYWTGIAYHENGVWAQNNAKSFCGKNAPEKSCKRAYSYCQTP